MRLLLALLLAAGPGAIVPPGLEYHRSPATVGGVHTEVFNAMRSDWEGYMILGPLDRPWAEGTQWEPPRRPASRAELAALRRLTRWTFGPSRSAGRVHLAYGRVQGQDRSWAWADGPAGPQVIFAGRAAPGRLPALVEWTWARHVVPACETLRPASVGRLPERWFR